MDKKQPKPAETLGEGKAADGDMPATEGHLDISDQAVASSDTPGGIQPDLPKEHGGPKGPEPTRYGDWERNGRCSDF